MFMRDHSAARKDHNRGWTVASVGQSFGHPVFGNFRGLIGNGGFGLFGGLIIGLGLTLAAQTAPAQTVTPPNQQSSAVIRWELSSAIPVANLPVWPVLRQGSTSPIVTVRSLQYLLNAHGAGLVVDGIFGPRTNTEVRSFQRAHGLVVDGIVGPRTWSAVIVTVRRGSVGPAVEALQEQANTRLGTSNPGLAVDGIFGSRTEEWVHGFQSAIAGHVIGYPVDGVVGPLTWSLLVTGEHPQ